VSRLSSRLRTNRPTANGLLHFINILGTPAYYEFSGGLKWWLELLVHTL
jgi:hypothetical protein